MSMRINGQRVREVEYFSFTPLVLAVTEGLGIEATAFYKQLASMLSQKWDSPFNSMLATLSLRSFRPLEEPARSSHGLAVRSPSPIDLATTESGIQGDS